MRGKDRHFSFSTSVWKQFKKHRWAVWSLRFFTFLVIIAILSPVIANDKPVYCVYKGVTLFPAISFYNYTEVRNPDGKPDLIQYDIADWKHIELENAWWPPCAWSPEKSDFVNADYSSPWAEQYFLASNGEKLLMPLKFRHWLGTNKKGEDVLAGLVHGTKISLTIGVLSMLLASIIGIICGALAGYFGDTKLRVSRSISLMLLLGVIPAWFYAFQVRSVVLQEALSESGLVFFVQVLLSIIEAVSILAIFYMAGKLINRIGFLKRIVNIPVDGLISRSIEVLNSIPKLILIISVSVITQPSIWNIILIIGLTSWTEIARLTRAEFLLTSRLDYMEAAKAMGLPEWRIIFRHALPNSIAPALVAISFGIAGAILTESSLSFLGIGVASDTVTWGSLLSAARENFNAWWLVLFPGGAIFITVTMYNLIGEGLRDAMDPRLRK